MNCLKDLIRNPKKCRAKFEREHAKELQRLSYKESGNITEALLSDPWISTLNWKEDDFPVNLAIFLRKSGEQKKRRKDIK